MEFVFDNHPEDISWTLSNSCGGGSVVVASGNNYDGHTNTSESHNVQDGTFVWNVNDSYGDGGYLDCMFMVKHFELTCLYTNQVCAAPKGMAAI